MATIHRILARLLPLVALSLTAVPLLGQDSQLPGGAMAGQSLRPYWHVFVAYTIAILLVMGWAGSIAKRLGDVEDRLGE